MPEQKTVFISYRRAPARFLARAIYQDLRAHDFDVFLDVDSIDSGDFDRIITDSGTGAFPVFADTGHFATLQK